MPQLREDPVTGRWVLVAKDRALRPHDLAEVPLPQTGAGHCPFCSGSEAQTPAEIAAVRAANSRPDQPGWSVRVVPNKFPALRREGEFAPCADDMFRAADGYGAHEVIIESPRHLLSTTELADEELAEVLWMVCQRMIELRRDERIVYAQVFKNVGAAAGASLEHLHSQLIALPMVPAGIAEELHGSLEFYRRRGRCVFCEMIARERRSKERIVASTEGWVAFCPFAARFPFETWIMPAAHASHFETLSRGAAVELARMLKRVLAKIESALHAPAYNYFIHTAPFDTPSLGHYHWHIELIPRVTKIAGFEVGTGYSINPVPPEEAAATMCSLGDAAEDA